MGFLFGFGMLAMFAFLAKFSVEYVGDVLPKFSILYIGSLLTIIYLFLVRISAKQKT